MFRTTASLCLASLSLLAGCNQVRTSSSYGDLSGIEKLELYAWIGPATGIEPGGGEMRDTQFLRDLEEEVDTQLALKGLRRVGEEGADVLIVAEVVIDKLIEQVDPFFTIYSARQYEIGKLTLRVIDRASGELVWVGTGERRLRTTATGTGQYRLRFTPTSERRDWQLSELVREVLTPLRFFDRRTSNAEPPILLRSMQGTRRLRRTGVSPGRPGCPADLRRWPGPGGAGLQ